MKYFRVYPWGLQLLLFLMMVFTLMYFGNFLILIFLPKISTYSFEQLAQITKDSPISLINTSMIVQGVLSVFIFLLPALLFAYLTHPDPKKYLGLERPGKSIQFLLVILVMLGAMPVLQMIEKGISYIDFGPSVKAQQEKSDNMMSAYLSVPTFSAFLKAFVVTGIIPAVGEELFFRGIILRFAKKYSRSMILPILFTAFFFAFVHTNIYGFVSIFFAGILLAVIYYLTGSLWCSIVAHLFFNGFQVILAYWGNNSRDIKAFISSDNVPVYWVIFGAIVFSVSLYLLLKNKTPLPPNWADDFPPAPPQQNEWDFMSNN